MTVNTLFYSLHLPVKCIISCKMFGACLTNVSVKSQKVNLQIGFCLLDLGLHHEVKTLRWLKYAMHTSPFLTFPFFPDRCDGDPAVQSGEQQWHGKSSMRHPAPTRLPPGPIPWWTKRPIPSPWPWGIPCYSAERPPEQPGDLLIHGELHRTECDRCEDRGSGKSADERMFKCHQMISVWFK